MRGATARETQQASFFGCISINVAQLGMESGVVNVLDAFGSGFSAAREDRCYAPAARFGKIAARFEGGPCPWFSKNQGQRGECKHILAAKIAIGKDAAEDAGFENE